MGYFLYSVLIGNGYSNPSPPPEQRPSVQSVDSTTAADSYRSDVDVPVRTAAVISKRKVASAPAAPAYKGNMILLHAPSQNFYKILISSMCSEFERNIDDSINSYGF